MALSGSQWTEPEMLEESLEPLLALAGLLCKALCETRKEIPFFFFFCLKSNMLCSS